MLTARGRKHPPFPACMLPEKRKLHVLQCMPLNSTCDLYTFACVLSDVHTKLDDVAREDLAGRTLLRAATQPLAVDEGPIAAFSVLQVELTRGESRSEPREADR